MVKIRENPIKMDDLGVYTPIFGNTHVQKKQFFNLIQDVESFTKIHFEKTDPIATTVKPSFSFSAKKKVVPSVQAANAKLVEC